MLPYTWNPPGIPQYTRGQPSQNEPDDRNVESLTRMFRLIADAVNGNIKTNEDLSSPFVPTIIGTTTEGVGTYTKQIGWSYSQGLFRDIWFDVSWTAHTGTGNLALELPYLVTFSEQMPFVGVCQLSDITFAGSYATINAIPDTRRLEFWTTSSAASNVQIAIGAIGRAIGHIRYIGQSIERT